MVFREILESRHDRVVFQVLKRTHHHHHQKHSPHIPPFNKHNTSILKMAAEPANGPKPTPTATSLVGQYKHEFQEQYNNVRRWLHDNSKKFKDCITNLKQLLQEAEDDPAKRLKMGIVQPLKNLTSIGIADIALLETFAWITIMMFIFWIGHNVCSAMFNPLLSILLTNTQMAALAFIIPTIAHRTIEIGEDVKNRFNLQMFAALHGIVTGYTFKDYHLHLPLPFIVPLFIAAAAYFIARKTTSRIQFLSISLLASFLANCLLGWIIAGLTFSYLLAAIMQTLVALVTLQYYFEHWDQDYQKNPHFYMLVYQCAIVYIQLALLFIFGTRGG